MTKTSYDADQFDALALRLFEIACELKALGRAVQDERLTEFALHDRKPREWLGKLEAWTAGARRKLNDEVLREMGARKAREMLARERARSAKSNGRKKK